ncbi:MAG TPA: histidinol-phosphatase [Verrucomicrobiae bacterium]|nr:histidinol-phosphatase [Verrucomicrobiae bacterium]
MPILCDYHMHTALCKHAAGPMEAYVERGIELGLQEIGFADHNPLPDGRSANVRMTEAELDYYVERVTDLRYRYKGKIEVLLGLEVDYVDGLEDYLASQIAAHPWDYIIGSIHFLDNACRQPSWPRQYPGDPHELYVRYFERMRRMVQSGFCDIVAHFDVVKRSGHLPGEREADDVACTLQAIKDAGICMEINTSGYRHAELPEPQPYPTLAIVEQALTLGIPLTVNSDAHAPEQVGLQFATVEKFLKRNGCTQLAQFELRQRQMYML